MYTVRKVFVFLIFLRKYLIATNLVSSVIPFFNVILVMIQKPYSTFLFTNNKT